MDRSDHSYASIAKRGLVVNQQVRTGCSEAGMNEPKPGRVRASEKNRIRPHPFLHFKQLTR